MASTVKFRLPSDEVYTRPCLLGRACLLLWLHDTDHIAGWSHHESAQTTTCELPSCVPITRLHAYLVEEYRPYHDMSACVTHAVQCRHETSHIPDSMCKSVHPSHRSNSVYRELLRCAESAVPILPQIESPKPGEACRSAKPESPKGPGAILTRLRASTSSPRAASPRAGSPRADIESRIDTLERLTRDNAKQLDEIHKMLAELSQKSRR